MPKKSKKQTGKQQPNRASEKKRIRKEKKLEVMLPAPEDLLRSQEEAEIEPELGNNGEPIPAEINEDAGKDRQMMEQLATSDGIQNITKPFDPKKFVEDILKKYGA